MTDIADLPEGRWALSRIIEESPRSFTVAAQLQRLGPCRAYYPPLNETKTGYTLSFAVVHFPNGITGTPDADTRLIPNRLLNATLGDLTAAQRNTLQTQLSEWLTGYTYIDWDNTQQVKQAFSAAGYTLATTLKQILLDVFRHIGHTIYRPKPALLESHNTEYLDGFSSDPSSRWTTELGGYAWDSGNSEFDVNLTAAGEHLFRYSANSPGSIEHEAQVTCAEGTSGTHRVIFCAPRIANDGTDDGYALYMNTDGYKNLIRYNAGTRTFMSNPTTNEPTYTTGNFLTVRLAAEGTAGSNVVISGWWTDHGASKPSDPGWYGSDGSPDWTYTDTSANRLDDSLHEQCGIGGRGTGAGDYDTRHCFWKSRAITDRSAGGSKPKTLLLMGCG